MSDTLKKKRVFSDAWLNNKRLKPWIRKVPSDINVYRCIVCKKKFPCQYVFKHADSACHRDSLAKNTSVHIDDKYLPRQRKRYRKEFRKQWLEIDKFKSWLRKVPNAHAVFCKICNKSLACDLSHIYRHAESKLHMRNVQNSKDGASQINETDKFDPSEINDDDEMDEDLDTENDESNLSFEERKKAAEIRYAALIAENDIPHHAVTQILKLLKQIEKDSNILKCMNMSRKKCRHLILNVLCPVETKRLVSALQNSKFSVFIDKTTDVSAERWMTFLVRYVCPETLDIQSQLVKLISIEGRDCSGEKLFTTFQAEMQRFQIPFANILALSCPKTKVMTGREMSFQRKLEEKCKHLLTFVCPCYSAAQAANAACATMPEYCEKFLKKISILIIDSPKDSVIFTELSTEYFQNTYNKIMKLCDTRWLSHYDSIVELLRSWDTVKSFLTETVALENLTTGKYLLSIMDNVVAKAYFLFLKYALNFFIQFNAFFQTTETRIHLLHSKSLEFLIEISRNFLKSKMLNQMFSKCIFQNKKNYKSLADINLGAECEEYLRSLKNIYGEEVYAKQIRSIRKNCLKFYAIAAEEIRIRLPVHNMFLSKLEVFKPKTSLFDGNGEESFHDVSYIVRNLDGFDEHNLKKEWLALHSDLSIEEKQNLPKLSFDDMWKEICKRKTNDTVKYPNLRLLFNVIRSLPNSNVDSEKTFSLLCNLKTKKRHNLSSTCINAICVIKSALKARGETALEMKITEQHLSILSRTKLRDS